MSDSLCFLDLFAGAGGLSEGFIRAGFKPVAHVEMDKAACYTLKTRMAYHWLKDNNDLDKYNKYLHQKISRLELYKSIPNKKICSVLNEEITKDTIPEIFQKIDKLLATKKLDIIVGGPPCQAYSVVGRSRDKKRMQGDKRNYLYLYYAEFLKRYKPRYFVFENVTGLLSAKDQNGASYFDDMRSTFQKIGYETEYKIISAEDYGILQGRKRIILIGKKGKTTGFFPEPKKWKPDVIVKELFKDLLPLQAGEGSFQPSEMRSYTSSYLYDAGIRNGNKTITGHIARPHTEQDLEIYRIAVNKWNSTKERLNYNDLPRFLKTHKNRVSFLDRFKVVAGDEPYSHTVVAHIAKDGHYYIHPDIKQNRSITPREAARLQSFPDNYFFESISETPGRTAAFKQIGNAVPVLLAQKIAEKLRNVM